jgi:hypothetical protein
MPPLPAVVVVVVVVLVVVVVVVRLVLALLELVVSPSSPQALSATVAPNTKAAARVSRREVSGAMRRSRSGVAQKGHCDSLARTWREQPEQGTKA